MLHKIMIAALVTIGVSASALAQDFFDFGRVPGVPDEPNVQIDLNAALLAFVSEAARTADVEGAEVISALDGVRVRVYEKLKDADAVAAFVEESSKRLERAGWQRTVYVADDNDKVRIYVKMKDKQVSGMTVMVVDDSEAVFMNISGAIDPAQLGRLARAVGVGDVFDGGRHRRHRDGGDRKETTDEAE
jgi:Domain of unknown function (DUF4252)